MRFSAFLRLACLAASASALPLSDSVEVRLRGLLSSASTTGTALTRRQFDPYGSLTNPYNPCDAGCLNQGTSHDDDPRPNPGPPTTTTGDESAGGNNGSGSSGSSGTNASLSYSFANSTYAIVDDSWSITRAVSGFEQGVAPFANTLPSEYSDMSTVWYSNNPEAFAIFTPPSSNVVAVYLVGSLKADRGDFYFGVRKASSGDVQYVEKVSAYTSGVDSGLHVLYAYEGLDPSVNYQFFAMNDVNSAAPDNKYLVVQGITVTTRTQTSASGGNIRVTSDSDELFPAPGRSQADTVSKLSDGPVPPYAASSGTSINSSTGEATSAAVPHKLAAPVAACLAFVSIFFLAF